ncbi:MAG TPA: redoxin domain-containing protein [Chloroflexota bacterium]|nr:redoxin domain-containing protein [Chloroflexota bacterium]
MTAPAHPLTIGSHVPPFSLPDSSGQTHSLQSFYGKKALAVLFLAANCRYVDAWHDRIVAIAGDYPNLATIGIAVTGDPSNLANQYPFPVLADAGGSVARSFGASHTPEVFLFDEAHTLRYHGAVDSDPDESAATAFYLRDALDRLLNTGLDIYLPETAVVGCPIKLT